ncbi:MAG TPA: AAA family ATPase, partial [Saprospiraceae bacterium]|nr:AAA family ATPase [Saprospiraceae bacterium]
MPKLSPLGLSDFKQVIERGTYYVDKTAMVRAVVEGAGVQLHCRPRRFGKTLAVDQLNLQIPVGSIFALLGENG